MDKKLLEDQYKEIANLILKGDKLIKRLSLSKKKGNIKKQTLDKLTFVQGLKSPADRMIKKNTDLSLSRAQAAYSSFMDNASSFVDTDRQRTKSPTFNFSYNKEGLVQHFANDLNIRMSNVDFDNLIKDIKRVNNSLLFKLKKLERQKEQLAINEKFEEIRKKIEEL